ncbi:ribosomal RNA-processing protein 7 homolog A-like [Dendronephthya gigantea]|uniref:ribosomal RNA-processing protein 7 homolog A-like n=1 Tax=Dendronephthya gigantea TaxID=151771 RepID=UPI00106D2C9D|nr:ribosomal RNA-processing protein 7 homolog A-like [Dendronephthya gigantea]
MPVVSRLLRGNWNQESNMADNVEHLSLATSSNIAAFQTIRVKFDKSTKANHIMYLKSHSSRGEDECTPNGRTLFVLNVPPYCTKVALRGVFAGCGAIQKIYIQKQPGPVKENKKSFFNLNAKIMGFKVAYIVFKRESSLQNALQLDSSEIRYFSTDEKPIDTGINKWCKEYASNYPNATKLQKEIDEFMKEFDKNQEEEKETAKRLQSEPDEEGWVTVGKGGRKSGAKKVEATDLPEKKKKKMQQLYFYNFQQRETRREHIAQLRKKFEEDKEKVARMKAARKFRPY